MRTYRLVSGKYAGFYTGTSGDRQVLMGFNNPGLLAIFFDRDGNLLEVRERVFPKEWFREWEVSLAGEGGEERRRPNSTRERNALMAEIGFREGPIDIKPFDLEEKYWVSLDEVTSDVRDTLEHPEEYSEEDIESARMSLEISRELGGLYGFHWGNDYYMNEDGTINTS
jgi:hypothetical protein